MAAGSVSLLRTYVEASLELGMIDDVKELMAARDVPVAPTSPTVGHKLCTYLPVDLCCDRSGGLGAKAFKQ